MRNLSSSELAVRSSPASRGVVIAQRPRMSASDGVVVDERLVVALHVFVACVGVGRDAVLVDLVLGGVPVGPTRVAGPVIVAVQLHVHVPEDRVVVEPRSVETVEVDRPKIRIGHEGILGADDVGMELPTEVSKLPDQADLVAPDVAARRLTGAFDVLVHP